MHYIRLWKMSYICQGNAIAMQKGTSFPLFFASSFKKMTLSPPPLGMKKLYLSLPGQSYWNCITTWTDAG